MKRRALMLLFAAVVTWGASADSICQEDEPQDKCIEWFATEWASVAQKEATNANTGVGILTAPSQSTAKDFLSRLAAALLMPMSGNGVRPLAIDYNVPLGDQRLKLEAVLAKPELSGPLKARLTGNAAAVTAEKDALSEMDDVTVSAALNPSTPNLGRSITPHQKTYETMLEAMLPGGDDRAANEKAARGFAKPFAKLLSNQPQFYGSVLYRVRKNVAGADERSARLTYEYGFRNLNTFHRDVSCKTDRECAEKLVNYAGGANAAADDPANRLALSVEYRSSDGFSVMLPRYSVGFKASKAHTFIYSIAYGRSAMMTKNGRLDLAVNYEDTTVSRIIDVITPATAVVAETEAPKPVRDRFVASATYTYKINDMMAMPLTLTYANHASYLGDVGRKLNAHFGITFKMPDGK